MAANPLTSSPLLPPPPQIAEPNDVDLEAGSFEQIQCRIYLETDGKDFIAPCMCKGTSKYVHRKCLDHWRAVKWKMPDEFLLNKAVRTISIKKQSLC